MPTGTPRLLATLTVRKTVRFVTTLRVYEYTPTPPKPVIETTGVEVHDSELPPSQPSIRSARPANVVTFPVVRRAAGAGK